MPLWRSPDASEANLASGLLNALSTRLAREVSPEDFFAYMYGVLCSPAFSDWFNAELEEPGPRVPITLDDDLFREVVEVGEELLFLHTYGERYATPLRKRGAIPSGSARATVAVSQEPDRYPQEFLYDEPS